MTRKIGAGVFEIFFAPLAYATDDQAPTAAELNDAAVIELTDFLTDGGFSTPFDGSIVDSADMGTAFNKTALGTYGGQPVTAEWFREFPANLDTAWTTCTRGLGGYFVVARNGLAAPGTFAIGDEIEAWEIGIASRNPVDVARNEMQRFMNECAVPAEPLEDFAVAA